MDSIKMWLDFALGILQAVSWPALLVCALVVLRKQLRGLLENIESAKVAGVETTFFKRALEDPRNSEETKDAVAQLWLNVTTAKGEPAPQLASERLDPSKRRRGQPASQEVVDVMTDRTYADQIGQALKRISEGRITVGEGHSLYFPELGYRDSSFIVRPEHGYGALWVYASMKEADVRHWGSLGTIGDMRPANPTLPDVLVVSPFEFQAPNFRTACWNSADDDDRLADVLEDAGIFDYVEAGEP